MIFLQLRRFFRHPPPPLRVFILLLAVLAYGSTGFLYFEIEAKPDLKWADAVWWCIVTLTTVGYGDFFPSSWAGRFLVAAPMMFSGIGLLGWVVSFATSALVEAKSKELRGMNDVDQTNHLVLFNFPNVEKVVRVIEELRREAEFAAIPIVLVDEDLAEIPPELVKWHVQFVRGNPTRDDTLHRANIDKAKYAIVLAKKIGDPASDAHNLIVTLAIEARAKQVRTTVECVDLTAQELLKKAGCDSVVCLSRFDAHFIGSEVLQPGMQHVIDDLMSTHGQQLCLSAIEPSAKTFDAVYAALRAKNHLALGVLRGAKSFLNVEKSFPLEPGDRAISIGEEGAAFSRHSRL